MSVEQLITDNIDVWTSAIKTKSTSGRGSSNKLELYGIKKLRELILELAVRGKLVPQDPNDEPASKLIDRIAAEKEQLIKDKKIKKQKPLSPIADDEKPFELPSGWSWCHLQSVGSIIGGGTPKSSEPKYWTDSGVKWLTPADLYGISEKYIGAGKRDISPLGLEKSSAQLLPPGSVLFSSRAPIGYVAITSRELATNQGFKSVVPFMDGLSDYLYYFLKRSAKIIDASASGTTFKEVSGAVVSQIKTPLPPLAEQKRIVAKVDELMALCDQLEAQTEASIEAHQLLVKTLLETLTNAKDAGELNDSWQRISEHFDVLFTTEDSIDQLKQTILQLAVMGKLVKQDPNDEPASKLLERIAAEKEQLIKDKKIKKQKPLPPIADDEEPFDLPDGWEWVSLSQVGIFSGGKTPSKANGAYWNGNVPWVTPKDMKLDRIYDSQDHVTQLAIEEGLTEVPVESILLVARSGILRRRFPVAITKTVCTVNQDLKVLNLFDRSLANYILLMMKGFESFILNKLTKVGTTVESLKFDEFSVCPFLLPPLNEQKRIIARVDELMAICDALKERLQMIKETQIKVSDTVLTEAI